MRLIPGTVSLFKYRLYSVMKKQLGISLRYKLLALMSILPIVFLAAYLSMATNLFYQDKKAYVFDSSVFMARSLAMQIKLELNSYIRSVEPIIEAINQIS